MRKNFKKRMLILSAVCFGVIAVSPVSNAIAFKTNLNKYEKTEIQSVEYKVTPDENEKFTNWRNEVDDKSVDRLEDIEVVPMGQDTSYNENIDYNQQKQTLSIAQAKQILIDKNDKMEYIYQGDEEKFTVLKEKNHEGYVFLPNVNTDIGYFVDKNTGETYYFHPSGYMDIY